MLVLWIINEYSLINNTRSIEQTFVTEIQIWTQAESNINSLSSEYQTPSMQMVSDFI